MIVHDIPQGTPEWHELRAGIPTASNFSRLITSKGEVSKSLNEYALELAGELYTGQPLNDFKSAYMERGNELEDDALALYAMVEDVDIQRCGFITDDQARFGCSPDALIEDDGMAEVKCLKAENHLKAILRFQKDGTVDPKYFQQTQGQMWIAGRAWCDLIFHHPDFPPLYVRQQPDTDFQGKLQTAIEQVLKERDRVYSELAAFIERKAA